MNDDILLRLYRLARSSDRGSFLPAAIGLLRSKLDFDSAFWGDGDLRPGSTGAVLRSAYLHDIDVRYREGWGALDYPGRVIPVAKNDPGRALEVRTSRFYAAEPERAALHERAGMRSYSFVNDLARDRATCCWLNLYRPDPDASGHRTDLAWIQRAMPHLAEAWRTHGALHREAMHAVEPEAVADRQTGVVLHADPAFPEAIAREWATFDGPRLPAALRAAWAGTRPFVYEGRAIRVTGSIAGSMVRLRAAPAARRLPLTARQREVASLYARGLSYKEIAADLGLAPATVRNHLAAVYAALQVHSRRALFVALETGA